MPVVPEQRRRTMEKDRDKGHAYLSPRDKFLGLSLESTGKSYYPQLQEQLKAARENEQRLHLLIDNLPARISYVDAEQRYVFVNREYEKDFGRTREQIVGRHVKSILGDETYENVAQHVRAVMAGHHVRFEMPAATEAGVNRWLEVNYVPDIGSDGAVTGFYALTLDLTEKKQIEQEHQNLERRLLQAQKLESLGTLAGGIAHDFNNILSPLLGYAEILKEDIEPGSDLHKYVGQILKATLRAKALVGQILTFSRHAERDIRPIRVQTVVREVVSLLRASVPKTIDIALAVDAQCGPVVADPTQIHQIVMNLCTNAFHAMEAFGGTLTIELKQVTHGDEKPIPGGIAAGQYALLTISDTGAGIEKEVMNRIFDPYFTTKAEGRGTGLGLSMVQGIVRSGGGEVLVTSHPGEGTAVRVYLPIFEGLPGERPAGQEGTVDGGTERILVVDDEEAIVQMTHRMLERMGYRVTSLTSSLEALEVFKKDPMQFDLILTDMVMPGMTGERLAKELLLVRPDIPVVVHTGFNDKIRPENAREMGFRGYLPKPAVKQQLARTLRSILDASAPR